jgi:ribosome-binding factor A
MSTPRVRKVADRIKVVVAEMLERRIKDPRLGFVTVTEVRVSGDTQHATVFYTVLGGPEEIDRSAAALASATGVLRTEVGRQLGMRHTPTLEFVLDAVPDNARHIEDLLERARESDAHVARRAAEADYAGDPDPYRRRDEDDAEPS